MLNEYRLRNRVSVLPLPALPGQKIGRVLKKGANSFARLEGAKLCNRSSGPIA